MLKISNFLQKHQQYLFLSVRVLLAYISINYGYNKMTEHQFGLKEAELNTPIKDLSLFKISWHLFGQEELFKYAIGFFQITGGLLLLFKKTELFGAFLLFPIYVTILIIDISFVKMPGFYIRIPYYLFLLSLIIIQYKSILLDFLKQYWSFKSPETQFSFLHFALLPIVCMAIEFLIPCILTVFQLLIKVVS
jgi:uncharacterized membrane protein YphA (DoxX/SURF4 family)